MVRKRRWGAAARGSIRRASTGSSVVMVTYTAARRCAAKGASRSRSRSTPLDLVMSENGVARLLHHLDQAAGELQLALHRLVAIGGRSNVHQPGHVARLGQFAAQHLGNVVLGHDLRFKIQPR